MEVKKIIIARRDDQLKCFADDGEILIAASPKETSDVKLRKADHFFIGINSGQLSLYGWVEEAPKEITIDKIIKDIFKSQSRKYIGKDKGEIRKQVKFTLESLKNIPIGVPVVTDFKEKSFMDKNLVQKIHRVFIK